MKVEGDWAKNYIAVDLSSMGQVGSGTLIEADDQTGTVVWRDKTGENKRAELGPHRIRIIRRYPR